MKQKFKSFPKLLGILAFFMLTNCSKDEFVSHIKNNTNQKNNISFEQFKKETGLYNFSTTIHTSQNINQSSNTARLADGSYELSDFDISTDIIKKLESTNITSYTFRIYPKEYREEDSKTFFNLSLYKNGEIWETTIIQFKPTELNYEKIKEGLTEKVEGKAKLLYKGDLTNYGIISGSPCFEVTIVSSYCVGCDKDAECDANQPGGCPVCGTTSASFIMCLEIGDGINQGGGYDGVGPPGDGIGPIGGDGNSGIDIIYNPSNSSSTTEPQNPIIPNVSDTGIGVDPITPNPLEMEDPCAQLKALKSKLSFTSKMNVLKYNIPSGTVEKGFRLNEMEGNENSPIIEGSANGTVEMQLDQIATNEELYKTYGFGHNHLANDPTQIGTFTIEDLGPLFVLGNIEQSTLNPWRNDIPKKAIILVNTSKGLFAMKINDMTKLVAFINDTDFWNPIKYEKFIKEKFLAKKGYNIQPTSSHDAQVTGLLRFMQDFDIGVDLYEGNQSNYLNWRKLDLTNNNGTFSFTATPCNP